MQASVRSTTPGMTRACPVGHPSAEGMKHCALCGRAYVAADQVAPPVSTEQVLAEWRSRRRAARAAALTAPLADPDAAADPTVADDQGSTGATGLAAAVSARTVLPDRAHRQQDEGADPHQAKDAASGMLSVRARVLSCAAAALFVCAFALGESVMAFNLVG